MCRVLGRFVLASFFWKPAGRIVLFAALASIWPAFADGYYQTRLEGYREGLQGTPYFATTPEATRAFSPGGGAKSSGRLTLSFPAQVKSQKAADYKMKFSEPFRGTITVNIDFDNSSEQPVLVHADLRAGDDSIFDPLLCSAKSPTVSIAKNSSGTVSVSCEVTPSELKYYSQVMMDGRIVTSSDIELNARVFADGAIAGGIFVEAQYRSTLYTDSLSIESPVPTTSTRLDGGSTVTFTAQAKYRLESRNQGRLALRAYDYTTGTLAFAGNDIAVTESPLNSTTPVTQTLEIRDAVIPMDVTQLQVRATLYDATESVVLATSNYFNYPVSGCTLFGTIQRVGKREQYWLPGVPVQLFEVSGSRETLVAQTLSELKGSFEAPRAEYCFKLTTPLSASKEYRIKALMQDAADDRNAKILIAPSPDQGAIATELRWKPFTKSTLPGGGRFDLDADPDGGLDTPLDPRGQTLPMDSALAAAETYWHLWRQVYLFHPVNVVTPLSRDLPLEIYLNGTGSYYCAEDGGVNCLTASSIYLAPADSVPGANPSTIWHEFGHHLVTELYGARMPRPPLPVTTPPHTPHDVNHDGFLNDFSSDSLDEGFASFWAASTSRVFEPGVPQISEGLFRWNTPTPQNGGSTTLEFNEKVATGTRGEEMAIAGIFWDLVDTNADVRSLGGQSLKDEISVPLADVPALLSASKPRSLLALYAALTAKYPALSAKGDDGLSKLDHVFLMHGAFFDRNGDGRFTADASPPEEIGRPADSARPWREDLPQLPGSLIDVTVLDEAGMPLREATVDIELTFGAGFESWNSTRKADIAAGKLYFEMPPSDYPATARISVPGSPGPALTIESATYWSLVPSTTRETFTSHSFVVPSRPVIDSLDVLSGPVGTPVTLRGKNFSAVPAENQIDFGGVPASVLSASETELTTRVPEGVEAGATAVSVSVKGRQSTPVTFNVTAASLAVDPEGLEFGTVQAGTTADRTITVRNAGNASMTVIAIASPSRAFTRLFPATPFTLAPGNSQVVTVRFAPSRAGSEVSTVYVTASDRQRRTAAITVRGSATAPAAAGADVSPAAVDFGRVASGQSRTFSVTFFNRGSSPLTVSSAVSSDGTFSLSNPALPISVGPGGQQVLTLRFSPASSGIRTGNVTVAAGTAAETAAGTAIIVIPVRGEGTAATTGQVIAYDDGSVETGVAEDGLTVVQRITPPSYPSQLTKLQVYFTQFLNMPSPAGAQVTLVAYLDPTGAAPSPQKPGGLLLNRTITVPTLTALGQWVEIDLPDGPIIGSGDVYAGLRTPANARALGVGFTADSSGPQRLRGWFSTDGGTTFQGPLALQSGGNRIDVNILIRGVVTPVSSSCTWALAPSKLEVGSAGGSGVLTVSAPAGCAWTASSNSAFVTLTGASGTGNGTVTWTVSANASTSARSAAISVAGLSASVSQDGAEPDGRALVPIVLSSQGQSDSFFTSELTLTNRGTTDAIAEITYTAALGSGAGTGVDVIPAGGQVVFPDAMSYLRSLGIDLPASGNRGGTLRMTFKNQGSSTAASATVRTASVVPEGRAGLAYSALPPEGMLRDGVAYICGLRQTGTDRSNAAFINAGRAGEGDVGLRVTVISGDPGTPASSSQEVWLAPGGFRQLTNVLAVAGPTVTNGYVKVERISGTAPWWAYGVINDQANSDGSYVAALPQASLAGKTGLTLPVIVETATYASELVATNWSTGRKTVRLRWRADGLTTPDRTASFVLDLSPGQQILIPELVKYLRDRGTPGVGTPGSYAGALVATVDGGDVFLGARTSSEGGGGRYGVFYGAVPWGTARSSAWLLGLLQDEENRTNLALVNNGDVDASDSVLRITLFDGATGREVKTIDEGVPARGWKQLTTVLANHAPGVTSGYARVSKVSGNNSFLAYAAVNDGGAPGQRSGDGAFVPMSAIDEGP